MCDCSMEWDGCTKDDGTWSEIEGGREKQESVEASKVTRRAQSKADEREVRAAVWSTDDRGRDRTGQGG